jgi:hypothetical protein
MKIPIITMLEIGAQSPVVRDGFTYFRRWVGKTIAGSATTRKDLKNIQNSIEELHDLIRSQKEPVHEANYRLDDSPVRPNPICNNTGQTGQVETGSSERTDSPFRTEIQSDRTG